MWRLKEEFGSLVETCLGQNYIKYDTDLISSLPFDIVLQIVKQLGPANIVRCQKVCDANWYKSKTPVWF